MWGLLGVVALSACAAPKIEDPRTARAEAMSRVQSWDEATSLWNEIYIASGATDVEAGLESARAMLQADLFDGARARLVALSSLAPQRGEIFRLLGEAHEGLGDTGAARSNYGIAVTLDSKDATAFRQLGALECSAGAHDTGLDSLRTSLKLDPENPETRLVFGLCAAEAGALDEAAPILNKALKGPRATDGERLRAARALGPDKRVIPWLEPVVRRHPQNTEAQRRLGEGYALAGRLDSALDALTAAAQSDPGDALALASLARAYIMRGEPGQARAVIDHARALDLTAFEKSLFKEVEDALAASLGSEGGPTDAVPPGDS